MSHGRTLSSLAPLVGIMARERTVGDPSAYDDAYQEGMIAAWQAQQKHPDATGLLTIAARRGVAHSVGGRASFGAAPHRGWRDAHADAGAMPDGFEAVAPERDIGASVDAVRVVATLAPADREVVLRRFWLGEPWSVVGEAVGRTEQAVFHRWSDHIKPQLRAVA